MANRGYLTCCALGRRSFTSSGDNLVRIYGRRNMLQEFKEFALRGNAVDMAVGIIIGAAFGAIVQSIVNDLVMPPLGLLLGNADFTDLFLVLQSGDPAGPYPTLAAAKEAGAVTLNYGLFINTIVSFLIISFSIFLVIRQMNRLQRSKADETPAPTTKNCPECLSEIPIGAKRCAHCTTVLE